MILVDTYDKLQSAMEWLSGQDVVSYDVETTGLNVRKDRVIGFGVSSGLDGFYVPLLCWSSDGLVRGPMDSNASDAILSELKTKKILCWNASFDLRMTKNNLGVDLLPFLHADVMLLKHTVDEEMPFGLKEVGEKIYGKEAIQAQEELKASIKANGGTAREYYKADTAILGTYCVQDCILTHRLFSHYSRELKSQGLEDFYYVDEVLPLYKQVTIPMEETGIQLDLKLIKDTLTSYNLNGFPWEGITVDIARLEDSIQCAIVPYLDVFRNWFLNKDYPLVTWSTKKPSAWTKKHLTQLAAWRADNPVGSMFNLQSKHHLKKLFFDTLKEEPLSRTPTGQPQVNEEFLDKMALKYDWAAKLIQFNKLTKIKTAYIDRFLEEQEDGILYPSFMQHRTVSGRYGSDIQQMPRQVDAESGELVARYSNLVRAFITARPGHKLISADYAQLEPRVFCHVSGDDALKDIFNNPSDDFYSIMAKRTERLATVSKEARQRAKSYALGIPYGLTGYKLQFEIGCSIAEGDALVDSYFRAFPKLKEWFDASQVKAIHEGVVTTQAGRVRHLQEAKDLYNKYGLAIMDDLRLWKDYHDHPTIYAEAKTSRKTFKNLVNNARNFQIQGLAASIINRAAIAVNRTLKANSLSSRLVMNIHDELVYDCPESEVDTVSKIIQDAMENTTKLTVPLIATPVVGNRYSECK